MTAAAFLLFIGGLLIYAGWKDYSFFQLLGGNVVPQSEKNRLSETGA